VYKRQGYSTATVNRRIKAARTIFGTAVRQKLLAENPFTSVKAGGSTNREKKHYVPAHVARALMTTADPILASCLALARFGGLRFPSEAGAVRLEDIDTVRRTLLVRSPKTAHHGQATRLIPLFPGLEHIQPTDGLGGSTGQAVTGRLQRAMRRIGVAPWPRLWQNLRASCETDLCEKLPPHWVAAWMGHKLDVAQEHYHMVPPGALQKATQSYGVGESHALPPVAPRDVSDATGGSYRGGFIGVEGLSVGKQSRRSASRAAFSDEARRRQRVLVRAYQRAGKGGGR